ncbi:MAG: hypothetical protein ACI90V_013564, partial [Bacillariaceae sp.]
FRFWRNDRLKINRARAGGCEFSLIFDFFQIQDVPVSAEKQIAKNSQHNQQSSKAMKMENSLQRQ